MFEAFTDEAIGEVIKFAVAPTAATRQPALQVHRILDLGSGPGVGTCELATRFPAATVIAVDSSAAILDAVRERAAALDLSDRIATERRELPDDVESLGNADVIWASMSLHHVGDESALLRRLHPQLNPGGVLCIIEWNSQPEVVTDDDLGRPGIWNRLREASTEWFPTMRASLPGSVASRPYPEVLDEAGYWLRVSKTITVDVPAPLNDVARRFAMHLLAGSAKRLAPHLDPADAEAIRTFVDPGSPNGLADRDDVGLRGSRDLYVATAFTNR